MTGSIARPHRGHRVDRWRSDCRALSGPGVAQEGIRGRRVAPEPSR